MDHSRFNITANKHASALWGSKYCSTIWVYWLFSNLMFIFEYGYRYQAQLALDFGCVRDNLQSLENVNLGCTLYQRKWEDQAAGAIGSKKAWDSSCFHKLSRS